MLMLGSLAGGNTTVSSVSSTDWDDWEPTESNMSAIGYNERCCLLVIFNFFSLDVETVAIDAAGRLNDIVYVCWLLKRDVRQARSCEWRTWRTKQQLYIAIAMAIVQSQIYFIVLLEWTLVKYLLYSVLYSAMKQCLMCIGELQQTTTTKMNEYIYIVSNQRTTKYGLLYATAV